MQPETAKQLLSLVAETMQTAFNAHYKLTALERILEKQNPSLFRDYTEEFEKVKQSPPYEVNLAGISALQARLVQGL